MRRTILVKLFAAAAGGLLLLAPGSTGLQPNKKPPGQARNLVVHQPGSTQDQKQVSGCNTSDKKDPFALNLATKSGASTPPFDNEKLLPAIQVDANHNRLLAMRIGVGVQVYDHDSTNDRWAFREPQANLYDIETGVQHGIHFAGPYWADTDTLCHLSAFMSGTPLPRGRRARHQEVPGRSRPSGPVVSA